MKIRKKYNPGSDLNSKIQKLIWSLAVPLVICIILAIGFLFIYIGNYSVITHNMNLSSKFSLSFKENLDLKMYHYCVESSEQAALPIKDVNDAIRVARSLQDTTVRKESKQAIDHVISYCNNLKDRMRVIARTKEYDLRQQQLVNNVYVLTQLIQSEMGNYIYYEAGYLREMENTMFLRLLVIGTVMIVVVMLVIILRFRKAFRLAKEITEPISALNENVRKVGHGEFAITPVTSNINEISNLDYGIQKMVRRIEVLLENVKEEERKQHMIQMELLQAQVSPHFLYNTLDTIVWMVEADMHDGAIEMLTNLSMFFRTALSKGADIISLRDEVLHTKSYLEIQHIRYSDILEYSIALPEELEDYLIPKLTLQPLVENALYHGVKEKRGKSRIQITFKEEGEQIIIQVADDGIGMTPERLQQVVEGLEEKNGVGFGVSAVHGRLLLYFGAGYGVKIQSEYQVGTVVEVNIPKKINLDHKKM